MDAIASIAGCNELTLDERTGRDEGVGRFATTANAPAQPALELPIHDTCDAGAFGAERDRKFQPPGDRQRAIGIMFQHGNVDQIELAAVFSQPTPQALHVAPRAQPADVW